VRHWHSVERLSAPSLEGAGGWSLVALLGAYFLMTMQNRVALIGSGVDCWPALGVCVVIAFVASGVAVWRLRPARPYLRPVEATATLALAAMVVTDLTMNYQPLRDLGIYLKAGGHYLAGAPVYLQTPMTARPADLTNYPFLYPPLTLPGFAVLSVLPTPLAQALWLGASAALGLGALRVIGVRWRWLAFAALWPPLFQGLWVGNVAVPALALFALGPWLGGGLVAGAVFKSYTGIASLWLVRERRWRGLFWGAAVVAGLAVITLPLTGTGLWNAWIKGLEFYQTSQQNVPSLYGFGLPKFVPLWVFLALAAASIVAALAATGREGLARFGTATVVSSPSLWGHGLLVAVPSMVSLRTPWLWLAIGITAAPDGLQWWWAIVLIAASWLLPALCRPEAPEGARSAADPMDLLGSASGPWMAQRGPGAG
jgi:hypothetical protein